ncbi:MAG: hypothetical protein KGJ62_10555 [Armatimonadetes bacterium]|nr:hypothetical protein [Armatimonadota bacterium]MDE2207140.1 hypothetical protein [Armatimonadota bacterium]
MELFTPKHGLALIAWMVGAILFSVVVTLALMQTPQRYRRYLVFGITFLGGLFFVVEFFWPTHLQGPKGAQHAGNFLTPFIEPFGNVSPVLVGWAVGLGLVNLCQIHFKRVVRGGADMLNSSAFFASLIIMFVVNVLQQPHQNLININENKLLYDGALQSLDATMFSLIAFYIVSAAYRAFRARSAEATLLLITAVVVMLGQISLGQFVTHSLPDAGFVSSFRLENIRNWLLVVPNTAAVRAIAFGVGIGNLAVALRVWLGLERGSYFDGQV